jgi:putative phosphoesterase
MRIALISDIHGNLIALEAVLGDIAQQQVDSIISLGDVATLGPQPKEVLARIQKLGGACIMGNHDAALLDLDAAPRYNIPPLLRPALHWCAGQLTPGDREFLRSFQPTIEIPLGSQATLLCFHGSPQSNTDNIFATMPAEELDRMLAGYTSQIMAGGHTHLQMLRQHNGRLIVNPGSVGEAFRNTPAPGRVPTLLPWAEYATLNIASGGVSVDLRRVAFDLAAFMKSISASENPFKDWLSQQYADARSRVL